MRVELTYLEVSLIKDALETHHKELEEYMRAVGPEHLTHISSVLRKLLRRFDEYVITAESE